MLWYRCLPRLPRFFLLTYFVDPQSPLSRTPASLPLFVSSSRVPPVTVLSFGLSILCYLLSDNSMCVCDGQQCPKQMSPPSFFSSACRYCPQRTSSEQRGCEASLFVLCLCFPSARGGTPIGEAEKEKCQLCTRRPKLHLVQTKRKENKCLRGKYNKEEGKEMCWMGGLRHADQIRTLHRIQYID